MKVLILAGGKAERMGGYPKPLTFVDGYTIFERQINWLKDGGIRPKNILVAYGERQEIYRYVKRFIPVNNLFSDGGQPIGDAGAIRRGIKKYGSDNQYLVLNGDILPFFKIKPFIEFCETIKQIYHGVIVAKKMKSRYGIFNASESSGSITLFKEKPEIGLGSCGIYFLKSPIYKFLPQMGGFAKNVLTKHYKKFCIYIIPENDWIPVETQKDIFLAEKLLRSKNY